jgi:hypothetical protein
MAMKRHARLALLLATLPLAGCATCGKVLVGLIDACLSDPEDKRPTEADQHGWYDEDHAHRGYK